MYREEDLVRIAKRENNNKRKYLVVNPLQGKHIPVKPGEAFAMFRGLADILRAEYTKERLLLIGFAETATAIGAAVAVEIGSKYMQTTREIIPGVEYLFFSEEHSHATEQKLVKDDIDSIIDTVDRIVFVEDEVTTGKTILNIIDILEKLYPQKAAYAVASLLNGMDTMSLENYEERGIKIHYLVKTDHTDYTKIAEKFAGDGAYVTLQNKAPVPMVGEIKIAFRMDARRLVEAAPYKAACEKLCGEICEKLDIAQYQRVLVLGTEEFMYPALFLANRIEGQGIEVRCHATTRSPITVSSESEYPLHVRYELRSLYEKERVTFIYDIENYDCVIILTDSQSKEPEGIGSLVNAVKMKQNETIILARWC